MEAAEICARLNEIARTLAPELLPNGRRSGNRWMFSGIDDHGKSESAYVELAGAKIGKWFDHGNAAPGEDKGDMLDLLRIKRGLDKAGAFAEAKRILGIADDWKPGAKADPAEKARRAREAQERARIREDEEKRERAKKARNAKRLYLSAEALPGSPGEAYMRGRGLTPAPGHDWPGSLKYHPEAWHGPLQTKLPAMVACIVTGEGQQIGTHRIFLQHHKVTGWGKLKGAPDIPAKMVLGNMWGGFVPIHKGRSGVSMRQMAEGEALYVTEGIEDAQAVAMVKPEARVIAAISLANIGAIVLPEVARKLVVVADRDENAKAQEQLERSIAQQQARGLEVSLVMPPTGIKDINEWLLADRQEGRAA